MANGAATGLETVCFGGEAAGVAAGGGETGASVVGFVGAATGTEGVVGVTGVNFGVAAGAWPPTPAIMMHISANPSMPFPSIFLKRRVGEDARIENENVEM